MQTMNLDLRGSQYDSIDPSVQCGGAYTSKLEGMLNDFILAEVMNKDFQPDFAAWREKEDNQELVRLNYVRY